ncbi:MAG: hypothetical protein ACREFM_17605 [Hypericibacter sp.]
MLLYHFTHKDALAGIMAEGLWRGEVPLTEREVLTAVNLTTSPTPQGMGVQIEDKEVDTVVLKAKGLLPQDAPPTIIFKAKTDIRIAVRVESRDRNLVQWRRFARKRLEPRWRETLEKGNRPETWWLYFGTILPDRFAMVALRTAAGYEPIERPETLTP